MASDPPRVLAVSCLACGAPRTRPSPTAYVYCDACGSLVDYDFSVAIGLPIAQPGPAYEKLRTRLAVELSTARQQGDTEAYRAIQRRLFDAWVDACPTSCPPRVRDPAYRAAYVAWLAEAQVVADFDADSQAREAAMHAAVGRLTFVPAGAKIRVPADAFRALADAMFDYEARRDELFVEKGVYALQPDGASREIQRRIGLSMFVQAWLPMLDAADAQALVERAGFVREYTLLPPAATNSASCTHCSEPLSLVKGATRVVCDHCGRLVDVAAST